MPDKKVDVFVPTELDGFPMHISEFIAVHGKEFSVELLGMYKHYARVNHISQNTANGFRRALAEFANRPTG